MSRAPSNAASIATPIYLPADICKSKRQPLVRVNYGPQQRYRSAGTEPACASCVHFGAEEKTANRSPDGKRFCSEKKWYVAPGDICTSYERAAGAD